MSLKLSWLVRNFATRGRYGDFPRLQNNGVLKDNRVSSSNSDGLYEGADFKT